MLHRGGRLKDEFASDAEWRIVNILRAAHAALRSEREQRFML